MPLGNIKKVVFRILKILVIVYVMICAALYFFQEKLIFFPYKLDKQFKFSFDQKFRELNITTTDHKLLNGILFMADSSKGLIFYLHGNAGALDSWGSIAKRYTDLNYDVFMLDYRGYGKSEGSISSEAQYYQDIQTAYDSIKTLYEENKIIVLGYSIGTAAAAEIASSNNPRLLILQAPYYSLTDLMKQNYPGIPTFLLKYKFDTKKYFAKCKMPIVVFHGDRDEVIDYRSSLQLKKLMKPADTLITLHNQGHNGITDNDQYVNAIRNILK
ncbi:MAG TPA: alpha/beta fold hydrolase [Chitinophagaceae bacterium]